MLRPVERSMTVSAPHLADQTIFSTSSGIDEPTEELPMLAFTLIKKLRPIIIGSVSGWLMLLGITARPQATSSRTNSGVMSLGIAAPNDSPACCCMRVSSRISARFIFSRMAMYSISGVIMPWRA